METQYKANKAVKTMNPPSLRVRHSDSEHQGEWRQIKTPSTVVNCRYHHASVFQEGKLYVYGGFNNDVGVLADLQVFSNQTNQWVKLPSEDGPGPRHSHSAVLHNNFIYIFGGKVDRFNSTNQLHSFNIKTKKWALVETFPSESATKSTRRRNNSIQKIPVTFPNKPGHIDSHQAVVIGDQMIVYGGFSNNTFSNAIFSLNLVTRNWSKIYPSSDVTSLNQKQPEARSDFSMVTYNNKIYIYAGKNLSQTFSDLWEFDLETKKWQQKCSQPKKQFLENRSGHTAVAYQKYMLVFGGISSVTHQRDDLLCYCFQTDQWVIVWRSSIQKYNEVDHRQRTNKQNKTIHNTKTKSPDSCILKSKFQEEEQDKPRKYRRPLAEQKLASSKISVIFQKDRSKKQNERKNMLINQIQTTKSNLSGSPQRYSPLMQSLTNSIMLTSSIQHNSNNNNNNTLRDTIVSVKPLSFAQTDQQYQRLNQKKLKARDGHTAHLWENQMIIFGGDRHMIAFNDIAFINLGQVVDAVKYEGFQGDVEQSKSVAE